MPRVFEAEVEGVVLGSWFLVLGSWFLVLGSWFLVAGCWLLGHRLALIARCLGWDSGEGRAVHWLLGAHPKSGLIHWRRVALLSYLRDSPERVRRL